MSKADIDAYFERIGFAGSIAPTLETLQQLHALHPAAIAFENLDPLRGVPVRLELGNLQQKLLFERRGGYCFEHNLLFKAMLEDLDFPVKGLAARVLWGQPEGAERPISHMALAVDVGGAPYLADVGFGGMTLTGPLRLRADVEQDTPHGVFRLLGGHPEWRVEARIGEEWRPLYSFELIERTLQDYVAYNDFVAADSYFRDNLIAARTDRTRRFGLLNTRLNIHGPEGTETRQLASVAELREVLAGTFGLNLPPADAFDPVLETIVARDAKA